MGSSSLTPEQRTIRAKLAAHASWANTEDRTARTQPARQANVARFERQVDPDNRMDPETRRKAAKNAEQAHMLRLSLLASKARRRQREAAEEEE